MPASPAQADALQGDLITPLPGRPESVRRRVQNKLCGIEGLPDDLFGRQSVRKGTAGGRDSAGLDAGEHSQDAVKHIAVGREQLAWRLHQFQGGSPIMFLEIREDSIRKFKFKSILPAFQF
jgi:hypothetical protein